MAKKSKSERELEFLDLLKSRDLTIINSTYTGVDNKIQCIDATGYKYDVTPHSLLNYGLNIWNKRYAIENLKLWLKLNQPTQLLIEGQVWSSVKSNLKFYCILHQNEYVQSTNTKIHGGGSCNVCARRLANKNVIEKAEIKFLEKLSRFKYTIISGEYVNSTSKIECEDSLGYRYSIIPSSFMQNRKPSMWKNEYATYNLKNWISLNQPSQSLVEGNFYKEQGDKLMFYCHTHNIEYQQAVSNKINMNNACPMCALSNRHGHYNCKNAEKYKDEWTRTKSILYVVKLQNDNELFYKIGVTKHSLQIRFGKTQFSKLPYQYEEIFIYETNMYDGTYLERVLHEYNKHNKYNPLIKFGGHTECFSKIDLDFIIKFVHDYKRSDLIGNN